MNPHSNKQAAPSTNSIGEWLKKLSAAFNEPLTVERIAVYCESLADMEPAALEVSFRRALLTCKRFPSIAELREQIKLDDSFQAESAWDLVIEIWRHRWHPDIGLHSKPPEMSAAARRSLDRIGGFNAISATSPEKIGFIRRDFIASHVRFSETAGYLAPTREEAKALVDGLGLGELCKFPAVKP